ALRSDAALVSSAASVLGTATAAARPCKARPASSSAWVPALAMMQDATTNSARPATAAGRAPNRSAAWPPSTMKAAETTREAFTAHSTPAALSPSSVRMLGKAAMIAVLLMPTASIVRHDDHRTAAKPVRWFNVAASSRRTDDTRPRRRGHRFSQLPLELTRSQQPIIQEAEPGRSQHRSHALNSKSHCLRIGIERKQLLRMCDAA